MPELETGPFQVVEREDVDVGDVVLPELSELIVHLRGAGDVIRKGEYTSIGFAAVHGTRGIRHFPLKLTSTGEANLKLAPGHYVVMVGGFGRWVQDRHEIDLSELEIKHLDVHVVEGASRLIRLPAASKGKIERYALQIKNASGRVLFDSSETGTRVDSDSRIQFVLPFERIDLQAKVWSSDRVFTSSFNGKDRPPDQMETLLEWRE